MSSTLVSDLLRTTWPLVALICIAAWLVRNRYASGLSRIPGPPAASLTNLWRMYQVSKGQFHRTQMNQHRKYGPLVRIGPKVVSIADSTAISTIYNAKEAFVKTAFYPIQRFAVKGKMSSNLFAETNPAVHRDSKKAVAPAYAMSFVVQTEHLVDDCTALFMAKLHNFVDAGKSVDLGQWLQFFLNDAFDVIGEITFSKKFGFLEQGVDVDAMIKTIGIIITYSAIVGQMPEFHKFLMGNPILPVLAPDMEKNNYILAFTLKAMRANTRITGDEEQQQPHVLSLLQSIHAKDPKKLSEVEIINTGAGNVFAGSDTTAIALRSAVYYLCRNPDKKAIMLAELDGADKNGKLSRQITYKETMTHLPYFCAVMKEAMRLHPSVGLIMERHVPAEGVHLCGQFIPGGTIVGINPWVLNYDEKNFEHPESFEPGRWLGDADAPGRKERENLLMFNFGSGSRSCTGKNISLMEMHKVLPELFRHFDVELERPEKEWKIHNYWFAMQDGLICRLKARQ